VLSHDIALVFRREVEQISQRLIEVELAQRRRAAEMLQGAFRCRKARWRKWRRR
jgi:hypothetical protein